MGIYAIHAPEPGDGSHALEDVRAVRSGFSFGALIFGPLWLLARGLWVALLVYVILAVIIVILASTGALSLGAAFWLFVLGSLFLGFAGNDLRGDALDRSGRPVAAVLVDEEAVRAERTYLASALARAGAGSVRPSAAPRDEAAIIGMFPQRGR